MVLGYDEKRPSREAYDSFVERLTAEWKPLAERGVMCMIYGSYVRGDYVPGRSDIDGTIIFPDDVVIDKKRMSAASQAVARAQSGNNIPFQVTVSDLTTMRDGRFNSYDPNFRGYFQREGRILAGPDYRDEFQYVVAALSDQNSIRFNLRKSRAGLLLFNHDLNTNYTRLLERFNKTLDATSRASKQIAAMMDGSVRGYRFSATDFLAHSFPALDLAPLQTIRRLYTNLDELDEIYNDEKELRKVWDESVTFFESLIREYIRAKPI